MTFAIFFSIITICFQECILYAVIDFVVIKRVALKPQECLEDMFPVQQNIDMVVFTYRPCLFRGLHTSYHQT